MNAQSSLPLLQTYPALADRVPREPIGTWPTPIEPAPRFAAEHNLDALWIKREDQSHPEAGGNKVRGLEFLLPDARRRGAKTLLTLSAAGSHHLAKTAWHARRLGLNTCALVLPQPVAAYVRHNIAVALADGAVYLPTGFIGLLPRLILARLGIHPRNTPGRVILIPPGGTSPLSCLGHVNAAFELRDQINAGALPEPDFLYVALGSLGTAAGLVLGCRLAGLSTRVVGVVVSYRWYCTPGRWARLARRTCRWMRRRDPNVPNCHIRRADVTVVDHVLGAGYAHFTESGARLARRFRDVSGIALDGTYTAKVVDGMIRFIKSNRLERSRHLLWHTFDGWPARLITTDTPPHLPGALRRYFDEPPQPLDRHFNDQGSAGVSPA